jgi:hypothetical protein
MTASNFQTLNLARPKILNGTINLATDSFKIALTTIAPSYANSFVGSSTAGHYADVSASEITGTGYTTGGVATTITITGNATVAVDVTCSGASWATSTISAAVAVVYSNTASNKDILGYVFLDPTGGTASVSSTAGTFSVTEASGLFTIT